MTRDTIVDRLINNGKRLTYRPAIWFERSDGSWRAVSWRAYVRRARWFAGALLEQGLAPGDCVAIIGANSVEWLLAAAGSMMARAVPVGIYQTSTVDQVAYIANHCEAKVALVDSVAQYDKLAAARAQLPALQRIVLMSADDAASIDDPMVVSFDDFSAVGESQAEAVDQRVAEIEDEDLGSLIYTSGTTGPPKGVMLTNANLAITSKRGVELVLDRYGPDDSVVSYLPLSHIAEAMYSIHLAITAGYQVWVCPSPEQLLDALQAARPTFMLGVPRVWEKLRAGIESRMNELTGVKAAINTWARQIGLEVGRARLAGQPVDRFKQVQFDLANKLVYSKLRAGLGLDQLRVGVTGAAPISLDVLEFFLSYGLPLREVYGQSEVTGPTTFNHLGPGETLLGSVGQAVRWLEVKLADDGEILVRGPSVFKGYYKDEAATSEVLRDGWLYSGDVGRFDDNGFLYITDRKKDLLITAGGKNVAPQNIEKLLKDIDVVGHAVVVGDRRKYLSALLTVDPVSAPAFAQRKGWPAEPQALVAHDGFRAYVKSAIERVNGGLARYETIKKWTLLADDFTVDTGELTPTQKVRRKIVYDKYSGSIESMYDGA